MNQNPKHILGGLFFIGLLAVCSVLIHQHIHGEASGLAYIPFVVLFGPPALLLLGYSLTTTRQPAQDLWYPMWTTVYDEHGNLATYLLGDEPVDGLTLPEAGAPALAWNPDEQTWVRCLAKPYPR